MVDRSAAARVARLPAPVAVWYIARTDEPTLLGTRTVCNISAGSKAHSMSKLFCPYRLSPPSGRVPFRSRSLDRRDARYSASTAGLTRSGFDEDIALEKIDRRQQGSSMKE